MADNFDLRKFITEAKLKIKVPVKEMARPAKEKYKLNPDFPNLEAPSFEPAEVENIQPTELEEPKPTTSPILDVFKKD